MCMPRSGNPAHLAAKDNNQLAKARETTFPFCLITIVQLLNFAVPIKQTDTTCQTQRF